MAQSDSSNHSETRFDATVVIVTKNRKDELRQAIESALQQEGRIEVLVIDDGSTDGTADMIRAEFPRVYLERVEQSRGHIVHRNRAAQLANSPVLVSIDDDAAFSSSETVRQTLAEFAHPRIGAVSIPSIDVNRPDQQKHYGAPNDGDDIWVVERFRGTAYAVRRDLFARLGGFAESFFHQGEEGEFCLRLLNEGYVTRLGRSEPILHFDSPKRDRSRMFIYNARNNMLFAWFNVPMPQLLWHLPATAAQSVIRGVKSGYILAALQGAWRGIAAIHQHRTRRRPVSRSVYRLSRLLRKRGPVRLSAIETKLPDPTQAAREKCDV